MERNRSNEREGGIGRAGRIVCAVLLAIVIAAGLLPAVPAVARADEAGATASGDAAPAPDGILVVVDANAASGASPLGIEASDKAAEVAAELESAGMTVDDRAARPDGTAVLSAQPAAGESVEAAAARASELPGVAYAQPNYSYALIDGVSEDAAPQADLLAQPETLGDAGASALPFRPFDDPYSLESSTDVRPNAYWLYAAGLDRAWRAAEEGSPVAIAVLDTGMAVGHEDLATSTRTDLAWDSYNGEPLDASRFNEGDNGGHGTHVAGIAAAVPNNGIGFAGASYGAEIIPIKAVNDTSSRLASTTSIIAAYDYLFGIIDSGEVEGLRVVNLSLGSYAESFNDRALRETIEKARDDYGIVTVCAGGNGVGPRPRTDPIYPADFDACVSVTALQADGTNIPWSDYNEFKDISAPGATVWSTYPASLSSGTPYAGYYAQSGTSMASPIVAGTFALLFSLDPDATVEEACAAIYDTATEIVDTENDRRETSGSHGALDAAAAAERLTGLDLDVAFPDVADDDWHARAVAYVAQRGIMTGYDDGSGRFGAEAEMTRAQVAQTLYNLYGEGATAPDAGKADVDQSAWYASAVNWVVDAGLMTGYDDGTNRFGPDEPLTREQLAAVVDNASSVETIADPGRIETLPDSDSVSPWAREAVAWAVGNGVINGSETAPGYRELRPHESVTRAMMAQTLMNALEEGIL